VPSASSSSKDLNACGTGIESPPSILALDHPASGSDAGRQDLAVTIGEQPRRPLSSANPRIAALDLYGCRQVASARLHSVVNGE
jgi:hypothetical protein